MACPQRSSAGRTYRSPNMTEQEAWGLSTSAQPAARRGGCASNAPERRGRSEAQAAVCPVDRAALQRLEREFREGKKGGNVPTRTVRSGRHPSPDTRMRSRDTLRLDALSVGPTKPGKAFQNPLPALRGGRADGANPIKIDPDHHSAQLLTHFSTISRCRDTR